MGHAEAEQALTEWKKRTDAAAAERDKLIRAAHAAGVSITRINELTSVSRTTVYKILGLDESRATT
jgi:transcriptional regulator of acetoin/glycerol metabolism